MSSELNTLKVAGQVLTREMKVSLIKLKTKSIQILGSWHLVAQEEQKVHVMKI